MTLEELRPGGESSDIAKQIADRWFEGEETLEEAIVAVLEAHAIAVEFAKKKEFKIVV